MGQNEVLEYLRKQRLTGNDKFLSIKEIYQGLLDMESADIPSRRAVWEDIRQLKRFGYLEIDGIGGWPSYIRLKKKYINKTSTENIKSKSNI